jgi:hypothetical protein
MLTSEDVKIIFDNVLGEQKPPKYQVIIESVPNPPYNSYTKIRVQWRKDEDNGVIFPFIVDCRMSELNESVVIALAQVLKKKIIEDDLLPESKNDL